MIKRFDGLAGWSTDDKLCLDNTTIIRLFRVFAKINKTKQQLIKQSTIIIFILFSSRFDWLFLVSARKKNNIKLKIPSTAFL